MGWFRSLAFGATALVALAAASPARAILAPIAPGSFHPNGMINFDNHFGDVNPVYPYPGGNVSFGAYFGGQTLSTGSFLLTLDNAAPAGALVLAIDPDVTSVVTLDLATGSEALAGAQSVGFNFASPVAVLFGLPVTQFALSISHSSFSPETVTLQAFKQDGTSLGTVTTSAAAGVDQFYLADTLGAAIAGVSIYATNPSGFTLFSIDDLAVTSSAVAVPEPASLMLLGGLLFGIGLARSRRG